MTRDDDDGEEWRGMMMMMTMTGDVQERCSIRSTHSTISFPPPTLCLWSCWWWLYDQWSCWLWWWWWIAWFHTDHFQIWLLFPTQLLLQILWLMNRNQDDHINIVILSIVSTGTNENVVRSNWTDMNILQLKSKLWQCFLFSLDQISRFGLNHTLWLPHSWVFCSSSRNGAFWSDLEIWVSASGCCSAELPNKPR